MLFVEIAAASADVAATRSRKAKTTRLAALVADMQADEVGPGVAFLSGNLPQGRVGVGYSAIKDVEAPPAAEPSLGVLDVAGMLSELQGVGGAGSRARRAELLARLYSAATAQEQALLHGLLGGGLRQGALDGVMAEAVAVAFDAPPAQVRRAAMLSGNLSEVATALAEGGVGVLDDFGLRIGTAVQPMLASTAESVPDAMAGFNDAFVEWKVDGARLQIHRSSDSIQVFTRSLRDVTRQVPDLVDAARRIDASEYILDAEAILLRPDGRPAPFQETMKRFARRGRSTAPLTLFVFDALYLTRSLIDEPLAKRVAAMESSIHADLVVPRIRTVNAASAEEFAAEALEHGHEGVMVKDPASLYSAGRRGSAWLKVKPVHTLDLVVLAVEWGSGRRRDWLSNIHLGARDGSDFVMLGKTFKGMTDEVLAWQTDRFLDLETHRDGRTVYVRPEQVVEIAFDGVQRSSRYPGGVALRFARVKAYRDDKSAAEADTIETVRAILEGAR